VFFFLDNNNSFISYLGNLSFYMRFEKYTDVYLL